MFLPRRSAKSTLLITLSVCACLFATGTRNVLARTRQPAAARDIKFTPATKDGRPVSHVAAIQYAFNL
jgi:hypothetical protein